MLSTIILTFFESTKVQNPQCMCYLASGGIYNYHKARQSFVYRDGQSPPIIDVLGYDGQIHHFSSPSPSPSPPCSDLTPTTHVGICNGKRLVILTCL